MRKTHMKLGLFIAIACLSVMAGTLTSGTRASAHPVQSAKRFHHWFSQGPHITVKLLSPSGRHSNKAYTGRALISGVGFQADNSYGPCDSCGNTPSVSTACIYTDCGSTTTTTSSTTTTTSTTTTSPTTTTSNQPGPSTTCSSYSPPCGGNAPAGPSNQPGPSTTCSSYSPPCGGNAPAGPSNQPGPSTCPSDCSGNAPAGPSNQPGTSTTCFSYSPPCGGNAPAGPSTQPGTSYNDCGCNTVNLQSSLPISAYTPGINLSQVPVNPFGEFRVIVNVRPTVQHYTVPATIWAVNTYNDQPSNYAPVCYCS